MELKGTIERISEMVQLNGNFQKREFVVKHSDNPDYPEFTSLEFIKDKCDILNNYTVGQEVEVEFNLKGRSWTDKQGEVKYFNTLQAWKINAVGSTTTGKPRQVELAMAGDDNSSDLPF
jgi:hypothetical protein